MLNSETVVFVCFNKYAFEPASWQKTAETESDIMEGTLMTYLEYEPCSPGTSGRLESLPDYHAEPARSPLAFPVASGSTCPLLPVSPINNNCVEKVVQYNCNFHYQRNQLFVTFIKSRT